VRAVVGSSPRLLDPLPYIVLGALIVCAVAVELTAMRLCRKTVAGWARAEGIKLEAVTRRWFILGPFQWQGNRFSRVFALTAIDREGRRLQGFVRVIGVAGLSGDIEVQWATDTPR